MTKLNQVLALSSALTMSVNALSLSRSGLSPRQPPMSPFDQMKNYVESKRLNLPLTTTYEVEIKDMKSEPSGTVGRRTTSVPNVITNTRGFMTAEFNNHESSSINISEEKIRGSVYLNAASKIDIGGAFIKHNDDKSHVLEESLNSMSNLYYSLTSACAELRRRKNIRSLILRKFYNMRSERGRGGDNFKTIVDQCDEQVLGGLNKRWGRRAVPLGDRRGLVNEWPAYFDSNPLEYGQVIMSQGVQFFKQDKTNKYSERRSGVVETNVISLAMPNMALNNERLPLNFDEELYLLGHEISDDKIYYDIYVNSIRSKFIALTKAIRETNSSGKNPTTLITRLVIADPGLNVFQNSARIVGTIIGEVLAEFLPNEVQEVVIYGNREFKATVKNVIENRSSSSSMPTMRELEDEFMRELMDGVKSKRTEVARLVEEQRKQAAKVEEQRQELERLEKLKKEKDEKDAAEKKAAADARDAAEKKAAEERQAAAEKRQKERDAQQQMAEKLAKQHQLRREQQEEQRRREEQVEVLEQERLRREEKQRLELEAQKRREERRLAEQKRRRREEQQKLLLDQKVAEQKRREVQVQEQERRDQEMQRRWAEQIEKRRREESEERARIRQAQAQAQADAEKVRQLAERARLAALQRQEKERKEAEAKAAAQANLAQAATDQAKAKTPAVKPSEVEAIRPAMTFEEMRAKHIREMHEAQEQRRQERKRREESAKRRQELLAQAQAEQKKVRQPTPSPRRTAFQEIRQPSPSPRFEQPTPSPRTSDAPGPTFADRVMRQQRGLMI